MSGCEQKRRFEGRALGAEHVELVRPLVERMARGLVRRLPTHFSVEDLESVGWLAVTEAFPRTRHGMPEEELLAFLSCRVRGAMLDYLRSLDPSRKEIRNAVRRAERAERGGADGSTMERHRETVQSLRQARRTREVAFEDGKAIVASQPESSREDAIFGRKLLQALENLPLRLREILTLRYRDDWSQSEIAAHLGVTPARISQLHTEAMSLLRSAVVEAETALLGAA